MFFVFLFLMSSKTYMVFLMCYVNVPYGCIPTRVRVYYGVRTLTVGNVRGRKTLLAKRRSAIGSIGHDNNNNM